MKKKLFLDLLGAVQEALPGETKVKSLTTLAVLECIPECRTMTQIAARVGITTGGLTGTVDILESRGLVRREYNKTDRRQCNLVLTDNAEIFLDRVRDILRGSPAQPPRCECGRRCRWRGTDRGYHTQCRACEWKANHQQPSTTAAA